LLGQRFALNLKVGWEKYAACLGLAYSFGSLDDLLCEGIAIPVQAWTGPEGPRSLTLPDFMTVGTLRW